MSRTFLATLHFDGTGFVGWQRQPAGRSVQAEFERVLERLFGSPNPGPRSRPDRCRGARRRTRRQLPRPRSAGRPRTSAARSTPCCPATAGSSAVDAMQPGLPRPEERPLPPLPLRHRHRRRRRRRRSAGRSSGRWRGRSISAALARGGRRCCRASTTSARSRPRASPSRTTAAASRSPNGARGPDGRGVSFHVEADRFLHHMVRMLVGTMVDIGLGRRPLSDIEHAARVRRQPGAPARRHRPRDCTSCAAAYPPELFLDADGADGVPSRRRGAAMRRRTLAAGAARGACRDRAAAAAGADSRSSVTQRRGPGRRRAPRPTRRPAATRRTALVAAVERASGAVVSINVTSHPRGAAALALGLLLRPRGRPRGAGLRHRLRHPAQRHHRHQPARRGQRAEGRGHAARRHRPAGQGAGRGSAHRHRGAQGGAPGPAHRGDRAAAPTS